MNWRNLILMLVMIIALIVTFFMELSPIVKVLNITIMAFGILVMAESLRNKKE
ncbi:MAG: hypothetical protein IKG46_06410 [Solobacterium sp.]|nr:hypothetical protein [Solobacterium sp.]